MKLIKSFLIFILILVFSTLNHTQERKKYWVYFKDKGIESANISVLEKGSSLYLKAKSQLTERALERRAKILPAGELIDFYDLPVKKEYIQSIEGIGGELQMQSRWLNAASFYLSTEEFNIVKTMQYVETVIPVARFVRKELQQEENDFSKNPQSDYGPSLAQYSAVKIPEVHRIGISGEGVLVGMLDTGFRWRVHESLKNTKVIAERDFINNDDTTANQSGDPAGQDAHGTLTMSILGSYFPGKIIGPAYKSEFILGKTEYLPTETQIEEDWWAAGIEWMESRGADIVSSSLGYNIFDNGQGYRWENGDFDGKTAVTSRAAARAARLGVVVVTAMGNEGNGNGVRGTILCPADADSIISVGAISISGSLAAFSSSGPTNDGRIKPDIVAPGVTVYSAVIPGPDTYSYSQGTSASTPITAGVATMVLSARPELTPIQVREALRSTASRIETVRFPEHPNNFVGWGRINALEAITYYGPVFGGKPSISIVNQNHRIAVNIISRYGLLQNNIILNYSVNNIIQPPIVMNLESNLHYPTSGLYSTSLPVFEQNDRIRFKILAEDSLGKSYTSPRPGTDIFWEFNYGDSSILPVVTGFALMQNYPNPFNGRTTIRFNVATHTDGEIAVYNLLGQKIKTLYNGKFNAGSNDYFWLGNNDDGIPVSNGVYFVKVRTKDFSADRKIMLLR